MTSLNSSSYSSSSNSSSTFSGGGSAFKTNGLKASKASANVGLALNYVAKDKLSEFKLDLDAKKAGGFLSKTAMLKAKFRF